MIQCRIHSLLTQRLSEYSAVALLGPRQAGKTALALALTETRPSPYLDLESAADRAKLADPELYLGPAANHKRTAHGAASAPSNSRHARSCPPGVATARTTATRRGW